MLNDAATNDAMYPKKEIGKDRPKKKAIDNPRSVPTVTEEGTGADVENNAAQETAASEKSAGPARAIAPAPDARVRELEKHNAALLTRVKELELERARHETEEAQEQFGDFQDVSKESQSIIEIVNSLERQLDDSFALRDALATDLEKARAKLSSEMVARRGLEERLKLSEAEAALVDPLRDELSFIEQERNEIARNLKTTADLLERTTDERDALAEKMSAAEDRIAELEGVKIDLEAQVLNLEERVADFSEARKELEQRNAQYDELTRRLKDMTMRLEATDTSQKALELDLATNKKIAAELREEFKTLNQKIEYMEAESLDLRERLEEQQVENVDLRARNKRLEQELKSQIAKHKATTAELEASQKALRDVRMAASRTGKRIESRYNAILTNTDDAETRLRVEE